MAGAKACVWLLALVLGAAMHAAGAPATAPVPSADCSAALGSLADCLSFVEAGSNESKPLKECCSGLKKVVKGQVSCLCDAFKQSADLGVKLNMSKALSLPSSCGVSTPSISKCGNIAVGVPVAAPVMPPSAGGPASAVSGGVPSPTPGISSSMNWNIPSVGHFATVAFVLCLYYWL